MIFTHCLFIQHCVYVLNEGGFCAIVLPDGQLFNSKNFKKFREWLCKSVNILTIVKVSSGVFEHTNIKTNVLCFQKNENTTNINFLKTNKECDVLKTIFNVSLEELKQNNYSFDDTEYIIESKIKYKAPIVKLGDVCIFLLKSKRKASYGKETGIYPFYTSSNICKKYVEDFDYEDECIIIGTGGAANIKRDMQFSCSTDNFIIKINNMSTIKFIYLYLSYNFKKLEKGFKGVGIKHISKEYLTNIEMPLPSLDIQEKIIEELSKIETSIKTLELRNEQLEIEKEQYRNYGLYDKIRNLLDGAEIKTIGGICDFLPKSKRQASYGKKNGTYPFYTSSNICKKYVDECDYEDECIIIGTGGSANIKRGILFSCSTDNFIIKINNISSVKYVYLYLTYNLEKLKKGFKGVGIKHISKAYLTNIKMQIPSIENQKQLIILYESKEKQLMKMTKKIESNKSYIKNLKKIGKNIIISFCN